MIHLLKVGFVVAIFMAVIGCNTNESTVPKSSDKLSQTAAEQQSSTSAFAFLKALQTSDKKLLYEVSGITLDSVEESRTKLTNTKKYKLTAEQRIETEHALRISGSIDFYLKKITPLLKGADIKITDSIKIQPPRIPMVVHTVKLTYKDSKKGPTDSGGKQINELVFRLQQIDRKINNKEVLELIIDNSDFIEIMDRNYKVK